MESVYNRCSREVTGFRQTTTPTIEARVSRLHDTLHLALPPKILHLDTSETDDGDTHP